jgi:hypothetical protein
MHPMGISLRTKKDQLKPIDLFSIARCGINAFCALRKISKIEIRDGKHVLDIVKRIDWIPTQSYAFYDDSGAEIDKAIADMSKMGENVGLPKIFVAPSSQGHLCYSKSGVKLNAPLSTSKKALVEGKSIGKVSSYVADLPTGS